MALKIHDFECPFCGERFERLHDAREVVLCACGHVANRLMSAPAVQTVDTHMRGAKDTEIRHGGYHDYNLRDLKTGAVPFITSVAQKKRILRDKGLVEMGSIDADRDKRGRIYS